MRKGEFTLLETNILYLAVALLLITVGAYLQSLSVRIGLIITEYVLVLLPVIIYIKMKGLPLKERLKFKKLRFKHILMTIGITIFNYPIALFFNLIAMTIISLFSDIKPVPIPTATNINEYIGLFFIIAISAGVCEEIFFRGMLLTSYERFYGKKAIIITSVMFGIFHFNPQNLFAPIILGIIFGYLVQLTGSIYTGIVGHIANNGVAVTIGYILNIVNQKINDYVKIEEIPIEQSISTYQLFAFTLGIGLIAIISGVFGFLLIKNMKKDFETNIETDYDSQRVEEYEVNNKFIRFIPVYFVVIIYFIVGYLQLT